MKLVICLICACVCFSRIVSESKTLVNGIDTCMDQTVTPDQSKVENNSFMEQSNSLCLPSVPVNSPAADSTEANVGGSSWFASLSTVVDSPHSYPKWRASDTAVSSLSSVTSCGAHSSQSPSSMLDPDVHDDELEPPAKRQLLQQTGDDDVSTTAASAPLLGQLLSSSMENCESQSHDNSDDDDDDDVDQCSADSSHTDSSTDLTCMSSDDGNNDVQCEGLWFVVSQLTDVLLQYRNF